jgi:hypothetical protein
MVFQRGIFLLVGVVVLTVIGAGTSAVTSRAVAAIVYQQNFESPVTTTSSSAAFGGFGQINNIGGSGWQVQGGGGGTGIAVTTGVDSNGVGGSQALFATWDHSQASGFTFNQFTTYGVGAPLAPLAQIQVSMDLFINGSESANNPLTISLQQGSNATFGERKFTPTLANGAYTHVVFTLDQATATGIDFDPAQGFNFQINHGAGGFGFDAGNTVRIDNALIQTVPEPAAIGTMCLALLGLLGVAGFRRATN